MLLSHEPIVVSLIKLVYSIGREAELEAGMATPKELCGSEV